MKYILVNEEPYLLSFSGSEVDLKSAIVGITDNGSSATASNNVVNLGNLVKSNTSGTKVWVGSQAEYDVISPKDQSTLYFITGSTE